MISTTNPSTIRARVCSPRPWPWLRPRARARATFLTASVAGYEVSLRVGRALGSEHYRYFHTTGTAGTFGAAVAAGHLLGLDTEGMLSALGNAGTQAAGLWQFLADGAMSKQLHPAKAAFNGVLAAYLASEGFTGSAEILLGERALLPAMARGDAKAGGSDEGALRDRQRQALLEGLVELPQRASRAHVFATFKTTEVSVKYYASCRHTHPAVDALLLAMTEHGVSPRGHRRHPCACELGRLRTSQGRGCVQSVGGQVQHPVLSGPGGSDRGPGDRQLHPFGARGPPRRRADEQSHGGRGSCSRRRLPSSLGGVGGARDRERKDPSAPGSTRQRVTRTTLCRQRSSKPSSAISRAES